MGDSETAFRISARRAKFMGNWAVEQLKIPPEHTDKYIDTLISLEVQGEGAEGLKNKIQQDFIAHNIPFCDIEFQRQMKQNLEIARESLC